MFDACNPPCLIHDQTQGAGAGYTSVLEHPCYKPALACADLSERCRSCLISGICRYRGSQDISGAAAPRSAPPATQLRVHPARVGETATAHPPIRIYSKVLL